MPHGGRSDILCFNSKGFGDGVHAIMNSLKYLAIFHPHLSVSAKSWVMQQMSKTCRSTQTAHGTQYQASVMLISPLVKKTSH